MCQTASLLSDPTKNDSKNTKAFDYIGMYQQINADCQAVNDEQSADDCVR